MPLECTYWLAGGGGGSVQNHFSFSEIGHGIYQIKTKGDARSNCFWRKKEVSAICFSANIKRMAVRQLSLKDLH